MTRVDQWIWAVRLYRTRSLASTSIKAGHVRLNGERTKPSAKVKVGDEVRVRAEGYDKVFEVVQLLEKRVGAPLAAEAYVDKSPPPPTRSEYAGAFGYRDRGTGRPTKRDRRDMERLRGFSFSNELDGDGVEDGGAEDEREDLGD